MKKQGKLLVIAGPTAVGKSSYAVHLAKKLNTSVISADSRQLYREMSIGTARITKEEMSGVPHFMVGNLSISENYDTGQYERDVLKILTDLFKKNETVLLVGGTGLYIRSVVEGLDKFPDVPMETRKRRENELDSVGLDKLSEELKQKDPVYYEKVDQSNPSRIIRALTVIDVSGRPFSDFLNREKPKRPFEIKAAWLNVPRKLLQERIDSRVDLMMKNGLLEEVRSLKNFQNKQALQTVGYAELFSYLNGEITLEEAVKLIKIHSRQYAKRQVTWFKKFIPGPELDALDREHLDQYYLYD